MSPVKETRVNLRTQDKQATLYRGLEREYDVMPFVKLDNGLRTLEIGMETLEDTDALLYCMETYMNNMPQLLLPL